MRVKEDKINRNLKSGQINKSKNDVTAGESRRMNSEMWRCFLLWVKQILQNWRDSASQGRRIVSHYKLGFFGGQVHRLISTPLSDISGKGCKWFLPRTDTESCPDSTGCVSFTDLSQNDKLKTAQESEVPAPHQWSKSAGFLAKTSANQNKSQEQVAPTS